MHNLLRCGRGAVPFATGRYEHVKLDVNTAHYGCRLSHQQSPSRLRRYDCCLLHNQHCFTQVLFIYDDRHRGAHGVKIGIVY
jgi:hypothetical protein